MVQLVVVIAETMHAMIGSEAELLINTATTLGVLPNVLENEMVLLSSDVEHACETATVSFSAIAA